MVERGEAALVDVREPWEWMTTRIPGATLIPMSEMDRRIGEISADQPVIFYCAVGQRSAAAADALRARGNPRAFNIAGGIVAWMNGQYPVEAGPTQ
jgi:rhodanese-related sulfurtransferase